MTAAWEAFRKLCNALEIRNDSSADRDRRLYAEVCRGLHMQDLRPRPFFASHPQVTETDVLVAFLDTLEPFARMLEAIFEACSHATRGAKGGNDLTIRYDSSAAGLRFDLEAFRRFRTVRRIVRSTALAPRYHSDFVPVFGYGLQNLVASKIGGWRVNRPDRPAPTAAEFDELFFRARATGESHLAVLDDFSRSGGGSMQEAELRTWFTERGVTGDYLPRDGRGVEAWRQSIDTGLAALRQLTGGRVVASLPHEHLAETYEDLDRAIREISVSTDATAWRTAVEQWLELPFWKKRWQVYEVWVFALWLSALLGEGGEVNADEGGQIVLRTGEHAAPLATLRLTRLFSLELWMEFPLSGIRPLLGTHRILRPDLVVALRHGRALTPLRFVECKQRAAVTAESMCRDAAKYLPHMPVDSEHLVVNYDSYPRGDFKQQVGLAGQLVTAVGDVRPGAQGLNVLNEYIAATFSDEDLWVIVVDTTGSMHRKIPALARHLRGLSDARRDQLRAWLVLYGDHQDTYTVRLQAETTDPTGLEDILLHSPMTSGDDDPEALEDALQFILDELDRRREHAAHIVVFADGPAHAPIECPHGYDFRRELVDLVARGCAITLVACGTSQTSLGWQDLPSGVAVVSLDRHAWSPLGTPRA